jgi:hypothetical protein
MLEGGKEGGKERGREGELPSTYPLLVPEAQLKVGAVGLHVVEDTLQVV